MMDVPASSQPGSYELVPLPDRVIIDTAKPLTGSFRFRFVRESGAKSAILQIMYPDANTRYSYAGDRFKYIKVGRSELGTIFKPAGSLEYTCSGEELTDYLDDVKQLRGGLTVRPYISRP